MLFRSARAYLDRFLVRETTDVLKYLPNRGEIIKGFEKFKSEELKGLLRFEEVDQIFTEVRDTEKLRTILYSFATHPKLKDFSDEEIRLAVQHNMGNLLHSSLRFYKHKDFYTLLRQYIENNKITLTQLETFVLNKKEKSFGYRLKSHEDGSSGSSDYLDSLDAKTEGDDAG